MAAKSYLRNFYVKKKNFFQHEHVKIIIVLINCFISCSLFSQSSSALVTSAKTTALFQAIRSGSSDELNKQFSTGADANDSLEGYSALMAAALNGSTEQMKILIEHGANVNHQNTNGITALWLSVPDWDKTILLLNHGADVNHQIEGYNVLSKLAAIPGSINLFHLLVEKSAEIKNSAPKNFLLYNAASSGDTAIVGFLIRSGLNVNDSTTFGDYPINNALTFRSFATLKMLVDNGANVNVHTMSVQTNFDALVGFTPLINAALFGDKRSFFYLIEHGADPNLKTKNGFTALMLLQQSETIDDPEMTLALINHGAIVSEKAKDGTDALFYARKKGNTQSAELLKKYANK
ncbi:MAG TPA: ankyrin repeat domain-containing protein [Puia sp.]|jgi:ankyrin repeat protein|nr:ankyrin repeat domain-containing protein [Puia sp.]